MYMEWTASVEHMMRCITKKNPEFKVTVIGRRNVLIKNCRNIFCLSRTIPIILPELYGQSRTILMYLDQCDEWSLLPL